MSTESLLLSVPKTLEEWRHSGWEPEGTVPRDVWIPLEKFFLGQNLTLWEKKTNTGPEVLATTPPNNNPRTPDGFAYTVKYSDEHPPRRGYFGHVKAIHCVARTSDNRDVLIRLVAKGNAGRNHLAALRRLATGPTAFRGDNHIVPVLREISYDDMVFSVFPFMHQGFDFPWFYEFGEVVDAMEQILEGIDFCHERLVAHLDLDTDNILINFINDPSQSVKPNIRKPSPFRAYFPIRYYINGFELSVSFDYDSDPTTRRVTGLPIKEIITGKYGRETAPEMLSEEPYCPFRTDVWQLGRMYGRCFGHLSGLSTPLIDLIVEMSSDNPLSRPTASEALERVRQLRSKLQTETLASPVPEPAPEPYRSSED